jgi:hypothetical protein
MALYDCERSSAMASVVGDYLDTAETVGETPKAPGTVEPAPNLAERRRLAEEES